MDEMTQQVGHLLDTMIGDYGFQLPIRIIAVGVNDFIFVAQYEKAGSGTDLSCSVLLERGDSAEIPLNFLFVDCSGKAARALMEEEGVTIFH